MAEPPRLFTSLPSSCRDYLLSLSTFPHQAQQTSLFKLHYRQHFYGNINLSCQHKSQITAKKKRKEKWCWCPCRCCRIALFDSRKTVVSCMNRIFSPKKRDELSIHRTAVSIPAAESGHQHFSLIPLLSFGMKHYMLPVHWRHFYEKLEQFQFKMQVY